MLIVLIGFKTEESKLTNWEEFIADYEPEFRVLSLPAVVEVYIARGYFKTFQLFQESGLIVAKCREDGYHIYKSRLGVISEGVVKSEFTLEQVEAQIRELKIVHNRRYNV